MVVNDVINLIIIVPRDEVSIDDSQDAGLHSSLLYAGMSFMCSNRMLHFQGK